MNLLGRTVPDAFLRFWYFLLYEVTCHFSSEEGKILGHDLPSVNPVSVFLVHFNFVIFCYFSASSMLVAIKLHHSVDHLIVYYDYSVLSSFLLSLSGLVNAPIMTCFLDGLLNLILPYK